MSLSRCTILELPKVADARGSLSFIEAARHIPFKIKRVFYLYDVPSGEARAGHALRKCQQFIIAMSGSFDVIVDDGGGKQRIHLNRSDCGLYVPPLVWRDIDTFSTNAICLVLASEFYDETDYLDEYSEFKRVVGAGSK
jgi:dTDP-4-dehydrorhamnose 3,5-epimerase-like enzyme